MKTSSIDEFLKINRMNIFKTGCVLYYDNNSRFTDFLRFLGFNIPKIIDFGNVRNIPPSHNGWMIYEEIYKSNSGVGVYNSVVYVGFKSIEEIHEVIQIYLNIIENDKTTEKNRTESS